MSKKDFKAIDNPALAFISTANTEETTTRTEKAKETQFSGETAVKAQAKSAESQITNTENRNKRVQIVLTPSLFDDMQTLTRIKKSSVNNFVYQLIEKAVKENKEDIEKYKKLFNELEKNFN